MVPESRALQAGREPSTDPILLARVRDWRKDEDWGVFVDRYDPLLRDWVRRTGVGRGDLDDVVQGAWLKVMRKLETFEYDPSRKFRGWLRRLAENHACDFLRRAHRSPAAAPVDPALLAAEPDLAPEDAEHPLLARARRIQDEVRSRFAEEAWAAFHGCMIEGLPVADVARRLGRPYAATYAAVKRIRARLREAGSVGVGAAGASSGESRDG